MRGGAGKRSGAQARRHPLFSFGPFAYGKDRNRLHVRATRSGPETGKDNLFCDAYDEIEQCLCISLDADNLPDKPWYDRPNGEWVYDREEPADHHDADEDEAWYGTYCHVGIHGGNQCWCCNTCSQCGRHMCEACTVRCSTCGSVICSNDARETKDGEWECVECERRIILGFIDSL